MNQSLVRLSGLVPWDVFDVDLAKKVQAHASGAQGAQGLSGPGLSRHV